MNLYAVIDADGFVLETWESPFEPGQRRIRQRGERLVSLLRAGNQSDRKNPGGLSFPEPPSQAYIGV